MRRTIATLLIVVVGSSSYCFGEEAKRPAVTRADLALALQRFEKALAQAKPTGQALIDANLAFEEVTKNFFRMNFGPAIGMLNDKALEMTLGRAPTVQERWLASLKVVVEPAVVVSGGGSPGIRISSLYPQPEAKGEPIAVRLEQGDKYYKFGGFSLTGDDKGNWSGPVPLTLTDRSWDGTWKISLQLANGFSLNTGRNLIAVSKDLDQVREANKSRLVKLAGKAPDLAPAVVAVEARNEILKMKPSEALSTEFLADYNVLVPEIDRDIAELEAGRNPFKDRRGDYWRVMKRGSTKIPFRVYVPEGLSLDKPVALVIALHGAGGDENMFMDAYGQGAIKREADRLGFIAVSPATFFFTTRSDYLAPLIDELAACYPIDRKKVYVLGHSMGGGATAKQAAEKSDLIAAAACMAGFRGFGESTKVCPTLILAAELDAIVPKDGIAEGARKAKEAGLPVEYKLVPNYGHTLVVEAELPFVMDWLVKH